MQPSAAVAAAAALCAVLLLAAVGPAPVAAAPFPCDPDNLMVASADVREVCAALYKFSSAMQVYLNDRAYNIPIMKKQDVDHVFLRFGRRR